jgi:energy-coupling factor transporter ATP-binding protein EcfA2
MVTVDAIAIGIESFALAKELGLLDRIPSIWKKKHVVLVVGATGTGKTNLLYSLTKLAPEAIDRISRTTMVKPYRVKVEGRYFTFLDTPGQEQHKSLRMRGIVQAMRKKAAVVLNVVSYGYHEGTASLSEAIRPGKRVNTDFLNSRRGQEIANIAEWKDLFGSDVRVPRVITVVTKADLWWNEWETVIKHYREGSYAMSLDRAGLHDRIVVPYCSVYHRFYDQVPLAGSFDDKQRASLRRNLLEQLLTATGEGR